MANNLAVTEQADLYGGTGGWVYALTDQTGSGLTDSFSATGLGFMNLVLVDAASDRLEMFGAGILELVEVGKESFSATATPILVGYLALTEDVSEQVSFTMPSMGIPFELAVYEAYPETLAFAMKSDIGNVLALSEWPSDFFRGSAATVSDSVLRHVRNNV